MNAWTYWDLGNLDAMVTVWALCYVSQVTPEHFLRCCRVHRPAEGTTACKASSIWMPGPEVKVLVLSQLYFYPFLRLFRRFALTDFNFFMWIYRVTLTYFFFVKLFFTNYPKSTQCCFIVFVWPVYMRVVPWNYIATYCQRRNLLSSCDRSRQFAQ